jgi:Transglutaminase-like superfamily
MLAIKPGVYFAAVDGEGVLMDLVANHYLGFTSVSARIWQGVQDSCSLDEIVATLSEAEDTGRSEGLAIVQEQLEVWTRAGLLVQTSHTFGNCPSLKPLGTPAQACLSDQHGSHTSFSLRACLALIAASGWTRRLLRNKGLLETLWQLQNRSVTHLDRTRSEVLVRRTVMTNKWLRRPFAQGRPDCLTRALTLAAAIKHMGIDADVCFGTRKCPFIAHAWIEVSGVAINEPESLLRQLTILARF